MKRFFTPLITGLFLLGLSFNAFAYDVTVAKDGSGNYTTVQAAVDAAPTGRTAAYTIFIKNGTYKEIINVPSNKPFLQFVGESVANTMLTYDNYSGKAVNNRTSKGLVIATFPNPVGDELTLEHPNLSGEIVFTISDIQGKKWLNKTSLNNGKTTIDTHVLPSGLYFIECQNKDEKRVLKFVKQ